MLTIRPSQMEALEQASIKGFAEEMLEHVQQTFPQVCADLSDDDIRQAVAMAMKKANQYGFSIRGSIRLYLEISFILGSGFDTDTQYKDFKERLTSPDDELLRAEHLYRYIHAYETDVVGDNDDHQKAAVNALKALAIPSVAKGELEPALVEELQKAYPQKVASITPYRLEQMVKKNLAYANKIGLTSSSSQVIYVRLAFLLGHGFLNDPLHPWVKEIISANDQADKLALSLYQQAMTVLERRLEMAV